jgi:hypothetical protein
MKPVRSTAKIFTFARVPYLNAGTQNREVIQVRQANCCSLDHELKIHCNSIRIRPQNSTQGEYANVGS